MKEPLASPVASCPECGKLRAALNEALGQLDEARKQIADLQAEIHELRSQLNRNSSNSSSPPSVDPPGAPKPVIKTPTGRKPGGQPGHPGHHRHRFPPERVNKIVPYVPVICTHCQAPLPGLPVFGAGIPVFVGLLTGRGPFSSAFALIPGRTPLPSEAAPVTPSRPGIRLPNSPSWRPTSPNTKDTHAPALAVATSIVARSHRRFAPMSSGHAWPR